MIGRLLGGCSEQLYAVLRIVAGLLFAVHGSPKLLGVLGGFGETPGATAPVLSLMWFSGIIEVIGGGMIALGLFTPYVAFIASGEMAVAYFRAHAPSGFWPNLNRGELAALYCFVWLYMAAKGSGIWSVDRMFKRDV